jgi:hypothetical protein
MPTAPAKRPRWLLIGTIIAWLGLAGSTAYLWPALRRDGSTSPAPAPAPAPALDRTRAATAAPVPRLARTPSSPPADAVLPLPAAIAPSSPGSARARFGIRWDLPGLCPGESGVATLVRRQALFAGFNSTAIGDLQIRHAPQVPPAALRQVAVAMARAREVAATLIDWSPSAPPPPVVLYRDDKQLQGVACVNQAAIGYYDGEIHVSLDPVHSAQHVAETVIHEYMHHALNSLGVRAPMWFHEGLAMFAAGERWFADPRLRLRGWLAQTHLPFESLVTAFPHTADEPFAVAAYYQSVSMIEFLRERQGPASFRTLARDLAAGSTRPDQAFARGAGLSPAQLEAAWNAFMRDGR